MAQRSNVPKFGNWESEENVPYTAYFDKARKGKGGGKMINPNDPQDNSDVLSDDNRPPVQAPPFRTGIEPEVAVGQGAVKPKHERQSSKEDGDLRLADSPVRHDTGGRRATTESSHQRHGDRGVSSGDTPKRAGRQSGGSDRSIEHSPLHPHYQARVGGRGGGSGSGGGVSSPSWERKSSEAVAPSTPGRSRLRSVTRGDETPDKGAAVPKFGEWDESNPSSADGYTHIFNKVREEKQSGTAKVPVITSDPSYYNSHNPENRKNSATCCCFSWSK